MARVGENDVEDPPLAQMPWLRPLFDLGAHMMTSRWPAMMRRATAAEYCDMTVAAFEREIIAGRLPAGIVFGGREHWRKDALDAAFARLSGEDVPDYRKRLRGDYVEAA